MAPEFQRSFNRRFRNRVLLPGGLILLITAIVCGAALMVAGRGTDTMSMLGQQLEVWRTTANGLDELSLAQESIGLCEECIATAGTVSNFVREAGYRHQMTNLSPKITANWVFASDHSRGGRFHSWAALLSTRYNSFIAASSPGK